MSSSSLLLLFYSTLIILFSAIRAQTPAPDKNAPCVCPTFSLEQRVHYSDYVMKAKVLSSFVAAEGSPFVIYKVKMLDACKTANPLYGTYDSTSDIFFVKTSRHTPLTCGGVSLDVGSVYVLFFRASSESNHGLLDQCLSTPFVKVNSFDSLKRVCAPAAIHSHQCAAGGSSHRGGCGCSKCGGSTTKTCKYKTPKSKCKWVIKGNHADSHGWPHKELPWEGGFEGVWDQTKWIGTPGA